MLSKANTSLSTLLVTLLLVSCGADTKGAGTKGPSQLDPFWSTTAFSGAREVLDIRNNAAKDDNVVVTGRVREFVENRSVFTLTDVALKATNSVPAVQVVERAFGLLEIHHDDKGEVMSAGDSIMSFLDADLKDVTRPRVVSNQVIRAVEPYQAQLINRNRQGMMLIPGQSLFILETEPAAWIVAAANEAEKAADINLIQVRPFGAFGRLWMGGSESEIDSARDAAIAAIEALGATTG